MSLLGSPDQPVQQADESQGGAVFGCPGLNLRQLVGHVGAHRPLDQPLGLPLAQHLGLIQDGPQRLHTGSVAAEGGHSPKQRRLHPYRYGLLLQEEEWCGRVHGVATNNVPVEGRQPG